MNVVLVNQFFPPAQAPTGILLGDLAAELVRRGHGVAVIASAMGYGAVRDAPVPPGVHVVRIGQESRHRNGPASKFADYLAFLRGARRELARRARPDALLCMTTPPFVGLLGAHERKRNGVPFVLWCMDLYPEALAAHGWLRPWNPLAPMLKALAREERSRASAVVALGPDMAERLAASGARRVETIPVWSRLEASPAREAEARALRRARGWGADEIVLLYSGNMGRAHGAEEFAAQLQAAPRHHARHQRGVVVGGDVHVVRQREVEAGLVGHADGRRQHAGLALRDEWEVGPRPPHDRAHCAGLRGHLGFVRHATAAENAAH